MTRRLSRFASRHPAALCLALLLGAYGFARSVRFAGASATPRLPSRGIPAGCPVATQVLSLLTHTWLSVVRQSGLGQARAWVDDLTGMRVGSPSAVAAFVRT